MYLEQDFFAGFMDGWLVGLTPVDFVLPVGFIVWFLLLYLLPLYDVDRVHNIGGFMFAVMFAFFGTIICVIAPRYGGNFLDFKFEVLIALGLLGLSLNRWNKKIYANLILAANELGEKQRGKSKK